MNVYNALPTALHHYLLIIIIGTVLVWYIQFLWRRRELYIHASKVPGPFALPIIGCMYLFLRNPSGATDILFNLQKRWPGIFTFWFGSHLFYFTTKPEYAEKILNNPNSIAKNDNLYKYLSIIIGEGLLTAPVKKWKHHRKLISHSFNQRVLDSFVDIFSEQSEVFEDQLRKIEGQKDIPLYLLATRCTLDIICQTAMGINMNIQTTNSDFGNVVECLLEVVTQRVFKIWYQIDFIWEMTSLRREYDDSISKLNEVTSTIIKRKNKELEKHKTVNVEELNGKKIAILDIILQNSEFTEKELKEEIDLFLLAGTETTAGALCFVFTILGLYPDIQQKVYEEVTEVLGSHKEIVASDLLKMKYTERVIKETLRLFPVAPYLARRIDADIDLGDLVLPKGSSIIFSIFYMHRNPKYWEDPLKFNPDRFLPENVAKRHSWTYMPFSLGYRNCIGAKYAIMNMKTIVARITKNFEIFTEYKSLEEIELKVKMVLKAKNGPKVFIKSR